MNLLIFIQQRPTAKKKAGLFFSHSDDQEVNLLSYLVQLRERYQDERIEILHDIWLSILLFEFHIWYLEISHKIFHDILLNFHDIISNFLVLPKSGDLESRQMSCKILWKISYKISKYHICERTAVYQSI